MEEPNDRWRWVDVTSRIATAVMLGLGAWFVSQVRTAQDILANLDKRVAIIEANKTFGQPAEWMVRALERIEMNIRTMVGSVDSLRDRVIRIEGKIEKLEGK